MNISQSRKASISKRNPAYILLAITAAAVPAFAEEKDPTIHQVYETAQTGKFDEALAQMEIVLRHHPHSAKAHFVEASILAYKGNFEDAQKELDIAKQIDPDLRFALPNSLHDLQNKIAIADQWQYANDKASLDKLLDQQRGAKKKAVLFFYADWSNDAKEMLEQLSVPKDKLNDFSFIWVDITSNGIGRSKILDNFDILGAPALILLDDDSKEIPGKRLLPSKLQNKDFVAWLDHAGDPSADTAKSGTATAPDSNTSGGVDFILLDSADVVAIKLSLHPNYSLYADRISLSINLIDIDQRKFDFDRKPQVTEDPIFGKVPMFTEPVTVKVDKASLRQLGCSGKGSLLLKYQTLKEATILLGTMREYFDIAC